MATLSFNPTRIRTNGGLHLRKTKPSSSPFSQSIKTGSRFSANCRSNQQHRRSFRLNSVSESSVSVPEEVELNDIEDDPTLELAYLDPDTDPESITEWELDFCSRPILDIRGKKVWELVACDSSLSLQYTKYFPNNVINSITLRDAIASITEELGVPLPEKIRFFRYNF